MWGGLAAGSLRAGAIALGCLLALPAGAEKIQSFAATKPAPGDERRVVKYSSRGDLAITYHVDVELVSRTVK